MYKSCKIMVFWRYAYKPIVKHKQHDSRRQVDATTLSNFDLVHDPCVPITDSCMHINLHDLAISRPV